MRAPPNSRAACARWSRVIAAICSMQRREPRHAPDPRRRPDRRERHRRQGGRQESASRSRCGRRPIGICPRPAPCRSGTTRASCSATFDFDSPPQDLLPDGSAEHGRRVRVAHARRARRRPTGCATSPTTSHCGSRSRKPRLGYARFSVPDRWQALLRGLRPSIFIEPLDKVLGATAPPALLAHLADIRQA